ncbi:hypothetical protein A9264_14280 [Vibrio sp. UCD-FRSSP16_10]|nr:hypothetical protein A9260_14660 [Vibrio sp. UCD-FRSSP16_30]OBT19621.1 hypothetical protein A9264_14280 [Vibrio sp. UCD-FRSSP16_10]
MEVVIFNCEQEREIERFKLSPYKMEAFLEEIRYTNQTDSINSNTLIKLYDAGRLTLSKRINFTEQLARLLNCDKAFLA